MGASPEGRSGVSAHRRPFDCLKFCSEQTTRGFAELSAGARVASGVSYPRLPAIDRSGPGSQFPTGNGMGEGHSVGQERQNSVCIPAENCTTNTHLMSTSKSNKKRRIPMQNRKAGRKETRKGRKREEGTVLAVFPPLFLPLHQERMSSSCIFLHSLCIFSCLPFFLPSCLNSCPSCSVTTAAPQKAETANFLFS
ncbi:MAG: hypothetical protein JWL77_4614 [Chthonomonadaceae bacterium]|nr:hypothetical protein [Chthonomonadaceae bacterium]